MVRVFYQWPLFVTGLGFNISNLTGSKRLLTATAAFQNEPFPRLLRLVREQSDEDEPMTSIWLRAAALHAAFVADCSGVAAVEFAMIVPLMLVLFFGTVEFSSGVAVDRKVTLMARTLSDLTSQNDLVTDTQLNNFFNASTGIMYALFGDPDERPRLRNCMSIHAP